MSQSLLEQLRSPVSMSMFARKEDMLHTLFQERREASELIEDLLEALRDISEMTDADNPESYRADDREGCLDTVFARASAAVAKATAEPR